MADRIARRFIPARPTIYRGIQMRSRLEARFAGILDGLGTAWRYEPHAYGNGVLQYLPDFIVRDGYDGEFWPALHVEVKPFLTPYAGDDEDYSQAHDPHLIFEQMRTAILPSEQRAILAIAAPPLGDLVICEGPAGVTDLPRCQYAGAWFESHAIDTGVLVGATFQGLGGYDYVGLDSLATGQRPVPLRWHA